LGSFLPPMTSLLRGMGAEDLLPVRSGCNLEGLERVSYDGYRV
jgi:hypothetical protein